MTVNLKGEEGDIIFLNYYIRDINCDNLSKVSRLSLKRYKNASANGGQATKIFIPFQEEQSNMNPDET